MHALQRTNGNQQTYVSQPVFQFGAEMKLDVRCAAETDKNNNTGQTYIGFGLKQT